MMLVSKKKYPAEDLVKLSLAFSCFRTLLKKDAFM